MYPGRLGQMVLEDDPNTVAFRCLDSRAGSASIETPKVQGPARHDGLLYRLRSKVTDLHAAIHGERQVVDIRRDHWQGTTGIRLLASRYVRERCRTCRQAKKVAKETPPGIHDPFLSLSGAARSHHLVACLMRQARNAGFRRRKTTYSGDELRKEL